MPLVAIGPFVIPDAPTLIKDGEICKAGNGACAALLATFKSVYCLGNAGSLLSLLIDITQ